MSFSILIWYTTIYNIFSNENSSSSGKIYYKVIATRSRVVKVGLVWRDEKSFDGKLVELGEINSVAILKIQKSREISENVHEIAVNSRNGQIVHLILCDHRSFQHAAAIPIQYNDYMCFFFFLFAEWGSLSRRMKKPIH